MSGSPDCPRGLEGGCPHGQISYHIAPGVVQKSCEHQHYNSRWESPKERNSYHIAPNVTHRCSFPLKYNWLSIGYSPSKKRITGKEKQFDEKLLFFPSKQIMSMICLSPYQISKLSLVTTVQVSISSLKIFSPIFLLTKSVSEHRCFGVTIITCTL